MRFIIAAVLATCFLPAAGHAEPGAERWTAASTTAMGITGNITLSPTRFAAAGRMLPLAVEADVPASGTDGGPKPARILRVTRPADLVLLNRNTLCNGTPVRWIVAYRGAGGRELNLAIFTGAQRPTKESGTGLCGTYLYSR